MSFVDLRVMKPNARMRLHNIFVFWDNDCVTWIHRKVTKSCHDLAERHDRLETDQSWQIHNVNFGFHFVNHQCQFQMRTPTMNVYAHYFMNENESQSIYHEIKWNKRSFERFFVLPCYRCVQVNAVITFHDDTQYGNYSDQCFFSWVSVRSGLYQVLFL